MNCNKVIRVALGLSALLALGALALVFGRLRTPSVDEREVAYAEKNVRILFSSAQNTFIHRNGSRMAASIEELGAGFRVGEHGALIHENIWEARFRESGRPEGEVAERACARPYRYAVLPVKGLSDEKGDARTTCVVALPVRGGYPALLMVAGPVVDDPQDFLKAWPVLRVESEGARAAIRDAVERRRAFDRELGNLLKEGMKE